VVQARFALEKIEKAIRDLGGTLGDVVRTRIYIARMDDWEAVARVHGEKFGKIRPANTLIRADPVGEEYLVEIEAEAVVGSADEKA
jgi:enamine deaminase RidA (YjgF/YER057c/UK114 family)